MSEMTMTEEKKYPVYGVDKDGNEKVMSVGRYAGDAVGQFALNTINQFVGQMNYFYMNILGMDGIMSGNIILIAKLVDAVTDLIMGKIVDKTDTKYGKARPWMLWMTIPTVLSIILLFTVPQIDGGALMAYGILSNIFVSAICYTAVAVPYYTMIAFMTKSDEEKGKIGTFRSAVGYGVGIFIGICLLPITNALGGDQRAWIIFASILAVISGICLFVVFKVSREYFAPRSSKQGDGAAQTQEDAEANVSILEGLRILLHNKYWIKVTIVGVAVNVMYALVLVAPVYYCAVVMGDDNLYSLVNTVNIFPSILGFLTVGLWLKKFSLSRTAMFASIIGIVGCVGRMIMPTNWILYLGFGAVVMYATIPLISCLPAMVLNTSEYNMYKYGVRIIGMTNASNGFIGKIGNGLGSASLGWVLGIMGYTNEAVFTLNMYIPLIAFIVMLVFLLTYGYDDKYYELVKANASGKPVEISK